MAATSAASNLESAECIYTGASEPAREEGDRRRSFAPTPAHFAFTYSSLCTRTPTRATSERALTRLAAVADDAGIEFDLCPQWVIDALSIAKHSIK